MKYQKDYSLHFPRVRDRAARQRKAIKILRAIIQLIGQDNLQGMRCLDVGCSVGVISQALAEAGTQVIGLDIDVAAVLQAKGSADNPAFVVGDNGAMPFPDETFDVLVCTQVYEHSPSLELLSRELYRLLKGGGVCFFSGPNRWAIIERHYRLPFLSWLPRSWADRYLRLSGRGSQYYESPRSAEELRRALSGFTVLDLTRQMLSHPTDYGLEAEVGRLASLARWLPDWSWRILGRWVPNFNWLLVKTTPQSEGSRSSHSSRY